LHYSKSYRNLLGKSVDVGKLVVYRYFIHPLKKCPNLWPPEKSSGFRNPELEVANVLQKLMSFKSQTSKNPWNIANLLTTLGMGILLHRDLKNMRYDQREEAMSIGIIAHTQQQEYTITQVIILRGR
jgi:hypothetical protein